MALKKPWTIKPQDPQKDDRINQNLDVLYKTKLESRWTRKASGSGITSYIYQVMETGKTPDLSANGSANMVVSYGFHEKHGTVIYAQAHSTNPYISANITDVTSTGLSITFTPTLGRTDGTTAATATVLVTAVTISSIVTGTWSAYFMAILSDA